MHPTTESTLARVDRLLRDWVAPAVHRSRHQLSAESWLVPGEPVPFASARSAQYRPHPVGEPWGRAWSTVWFHVTGRVPAHWPEPGTRLELVVDLGFNEQMPGFQAEGAAWSPDGRLLKGISPRNAWLPLPQVGGSEVDLYLEAAANPDAYLGSWTTPTVMGDPATVPDRDLYRLRALDVALVDLEVEKLVADLKALRGLAEVLPAVSPRRAQLVEALAEACDALDPGDVAGSAGSARAALAPALAAPASASAHRIHAVGHAHIDSAWLWPTRETARKVARTVANVLALMDTDADVAFAFSSAQHYAWLQESAPELFERLAVRVREGRIVPVGGMWVESDTNLVGGEALVRQFVEGSRYFREQLGQAPTVAWLPDSFGYTAALPQIARLAGFSDLFAQKMCWNDTNPFPHHTFWWEGLDGSRLFTHFTPMDTYNARLVASQLDRASRQFADKAGSNTSLAAFGFGDGGGGPTREMVAQARRTADLDGSPRVELSTPQRFFDAARAEYADRAPTWVGEMYLEFHRGTYTSQARTKRGNRRSEHLLREAELWATTAAVRTGAPYPREVLQRIWRRVLLQQFHDILPGSSIAWVHREAEAGYAAIAAELEGVIAAALAALAGTRGTDPDAAGPPRRRVANASPYPALGVPAGGVGVPLEPTPAVVEPDGTHWLLRNESLLVRVDARGLVTSAIHLESGREVVPPGEVGNLLQTFRDIPNDFEAWNLDEHYRRVGHDLVEVVAVSRVDGDQEGQGPALRVERSFGASRVVQHLRLAAGDDPTLHVETRVDWHERHTLLKLGFALDVQTTDAAAEIQFGHVRRPTHANTSWDAARFEVPAHRWVHVGEPDFGVAVSNDATYGHDITRVRHAGGVGTRVRLSLLRAPMYPDPDADLGDHTFRVAVTFGADLLRAGAQGWALNLPLRDVDAASPGAGDVAPLVRVDNPSAVVSTVKLADDGGPDVIVRVYEALGTRAQVRLQVDFPYHAATVTDLLEDPMPDHPGAAALAGLTTGAAEVPITLRPFEILTLRFTR